MALGLEYLTTFLEDIFKKMTEWLMKNKKVVSYVDDLPDLLKAYAKILRNNSEYKQCLEYIKAKGRVFGQWITIEHEAMIRLYTGGIYVKLNKALRGLGERLTPEFQMMQKLLDDALEKLPVSEHNKNALLRSAEFTEEQIRKLFKPGSIFKDKAFFSTTYSEDALLTWLTQFSSQNVVFKVFGKNGKLIEKASQLPDECELLFKSGTEFVVESVNKIKHPVTGQEKIFEIILKEK